MPLWRLQAGTAQDSIDLRRAGHPMTGRVPRSRLDLTERGFVLEVEEAWQDRSEDWYCRERAEARGRRGSGGLITADQTGVAGLLNPAAADSHS